MYIFLVLLLTTSVLAAAKQTKPEMSERADCQDYREGVPHYRIVRHFAADAKPGLLLFVSISQADADRKKLLALGCEIGRDYSNTQNLFVHIYDREVAARRANPLGEGDDSPTVLSYRAFYSFSRDPGDAFGQSLTWRPDREKGDKWLRINLGSPPARH